VTARLAAGDRLTRIQSSLSGAITDSGGMLYLAGQPVMSYAELIQLVAVGRRARAAGMSLGRGKLEDAITGLGEIRAMLTTGWPR
jgi:hypothetical protein